MRAGSIRVGQTVRRQALSAVGLAALVGASATPWQPALAQTDPSEGAAPEAESGREASSGQSDDVLADDIAFRELMGLNTDRGYLERLRADPAALELEARFGLLGTEEERQQVDRQIQLQNQLAENEPAIRERLGEEYGGLSIDQRAGGVVTIRSTDIAVARQMDLSDLISVDGAEVVYEEVTSSLLELETRAEEVVSSLDALQEQGIVLSGTGPDIRANTLQIGVEELGPDTESVLRARFGEDIILEATGLAVSESRTTNFPPMKSGLSINNGSDICTAGPFVRNSSGQIRVLTAGHCVSDTGGVPSGQKWAVGNFADCCAPLGNRLFNNTFADIATLSIDTSKVGTNCVYWSDTACYPYAAAKSPVDGATLKLSGRTSGIQVGEVLDQNITVFNFAAGQFTVRNAGKAYYTSDDGDSGAPLFSPISTSDGTTAYYASHMGRLPQNQQYRIYSPWASISHSYSGSVTFEIDV